jgi:hypothetical protein
VDERIWNCGAGWTVTAEINVFGGPSMTSREKMNAFSELLDKKLEGEIDVDIFEWIWDRFAETGAHGKQYTETFRPEMRAHMRPDSKWTWSY